MKTHEPNWTKKQIKDFHRVAKGTSWTGDQFVEYHTMEYKAMFGHEHLRLVNMQHLPLLKKGIAPEGLTRMQTMTLNAMGTGKMWLIRCYKWKTIKGRYWIVYGDGSGCCPLGVSTSTVISLLKKGLIKEDPENQRWMGDAYKLT